MNIFIRSSRNPRKKANDLHVENHWFIRITVNWEYFCYRISGYFSFG